MEDNQTQEDPQNGTQQTQETLKAQLEQAEVARDEANKAKSALEEAMTEKNARLAELETALNEAKQESETSATELASTREARNQAVSKYLGMAKAINPQVPGGMISGETIDEIDASVEKGKGLVAAVKKTLESEAAAAKVPAGAPTRGESTEGMSNKELIAAGIKQQGGS